MKSFFIKTFIVLSLSLVILSPIFTGNVFAYSFDENSGLKATAEETGHTELKTTTGNPVFALVLPLLGIIYLLLMMYAGYLWMTAQGNEQQVTKARNIIIAATIGLVIILSSYAIAIYVVSSFGEGFVAGA